MRLQDVGTSSMILESLAVEYCERLGEFITNLVKFVETRSS